MNSIFRKWLMVYLAILLVTIVGLSVLVSLFLQLDVYRQNKQALESLASQVEEAYLQFSQGKMNAQEMTKQLKDMEKNADVRVSIVGKKVSFLKADLLNYGEQPTVNRLVKQVQEGSDIYKIGPLQDNGRDRMMIVGHPLKQNGQTAAAAFVYKPVSNIKTLISRMNRILVLVSLCITVPVILILFFVSRRFIRPLQEMRQTAASIADGNFKRRVVHKGNDELGDLAHSFNEMADKLERVETGRRQLISEISHELRTPLTTVRASLQGLSDGILTKEEESEFTHIALKETRRMSQLIEDLLQVSAFEESHVQLQKKKFDLSGLLRETVSQMAAKFDERGIGLAADIPESVSIRADPDRIRQVLLNLLDNTAKHNPSGTQAGVKLKEDAGVCVITIWDRGPGIPADAAARLFDRLYKADSSRHTPGAGLGLTIAKHIVDAHGGRITVDSELGKGTVFTVRLASV